MPDFLRDLAIAWKGLLAYPEGHPLRAGAVVKAHDSLRGVLAGAAPLVLGVSRDGLLQGQHKLDSIPAQRIAEALHRQRVALVFFDAAVEARELEQFLAALTVDPRLTEAAPIWERLAAAGVQGIAIEPVDYQGVVLTEDRALPGLEPASIWEAIARELMAGRRLSPHAAERALMAQGSAADLAQWIELLIREAESGAAPGGSAAAPVEPPGPAGNPASGGSLQESAPDAKAAAGGSGPTAGQLGLAIGRAVTATLGRLRGPARQTATQQILDLGNRLPSALRPGLLQASVRGLAADEDAVAALRTLAARQPAGVLSALRQIVAERGRLSPSATRVAQELVAAGRAQQEGASALDPQVLAAMRQLYREADIDRLPQAAGTPTIEPPPARRLAAGELPDLGERRDTLADPFLARQLTHTLLELIGNREPGQAPSEATLWRLEDLYRGFLLAGRIRQAIEIAEALRAMLEQARAAGGPDVELRRAVERLANREAIKALLQALPELPEDGAAAARDLIALLGAVAVRHLVGTLSEETDRTQRRLLLGLLSSLGPTVVPDATMLLGDSRWFVVRNMILLLRGVADQTSLPQVRRCAAHPDLRVRLEAIKSLFAFDQQMPIELLTKAINDPDPKLAEAAISLVGAYEIGQAVAPLAALLRRWDFFALRRPVRLRALKTLGRLGDPAALPLLEPFFKERLVQVRAREERIAAFAALADYGAEARRPYLERGLRSRDPEVRAACERVRAGGERAPAERVAEEAHD